MKKALSLSFLLLFLVHGFTGYSQKRVVAEDRSAQQQEFRKVQFGLGLGLNTSSLNADWGVDIVSHPGLNLGTYVKFRFVKAIALQPGVQLSTQGVTFDNGNRVDMSYLQIPIVLKIYAVQGLNFDVGPQLGARLSAKLWDDYAEESENWNDYFTSMDMALRLGINYEFRFGLFISTHYNIGLTNVNDADDRTEFPVNNRVFQLGVGYYF